jgi:hypothetical protein
MKILSACLALLALGSITAYSQPAAGRDVIVRVEGTVFLGGQRVEPSALNLPMLGSSLVHAEKGRAEIRLASGDSVFLGENGSVRLIDSGLNFRRFEMIAGSAVVVTGKLGPVVECEGDVQLSDSGVFRFDVHTVLNEKFCRVKAYKGAAAAQMPSFIWVWTDGEMVDLNRLCGDHTPRQEFKIGDIDDLDPWSRRSIRFEVSDSAGNVTSRSRNLDE